MGYNLPGITNLNLTMEAVVGIYNGTVTQWNDSLIAAYNKDTQLPPNQIRPCVRIDQSGTTYIFTAALSNHSTAWREQYGKFSSGLDIEDGKEVPTRWPNGTIKLIGKTNRAVSGIILSYAYSLGYLAVSEAVVAHMTYANIVTDDGHQLILSTANLRRAMIDSYQELESSANLKVDLVNYVSEGTYPIIGYSYFVTNTERVNDCNAGREFVRYVDFILTETFARKEAEDFIMAVPPVILDRMIIDRILKKLYCGNQNLYQLMEEQKYNENLSTQTWRLPVMIISPVIGVVVLVLIGYTGWQQLKLRNAILSDDWKISGNSVKLLWSRKWGNCYQSAGSALSVTVTAASTHSMVPNNHVAGVGVWKGQKICLRDALSPNLQTSRKETKRNLIKMRDNIHHLNVLRFFGVCYMEEGMFLMSDYAPKGNLSDVVQNEKYRIDDNIKFSLAIDIASGMQYLHEQGIIHGMLSPQCCLIDAKWNIKISDWEHSKLEWIGSIRKRSRVSPMLDEKIKDNSSVDPNILARSQFWTCPEVLRSLELSSIARRTGDVYSFSILLVEIFLREDPYSELTGVMEPVEIIEAVITADIRPAITLITSSGLTRIITDAWSGDTQKRPTYQSLCKSLKILRPSRKSVMDCMMETLEDYIGNLEEKVEERTAELASANKGLQNLLHQILPPSVADRLANGESVPPEQYESATIYFSDIVGFTKISEASSPMEVVSMLNDLYNIFDWIIDKHDVYKVETIGDAYMVISGLPRRNGAMHAAAIATMALDLVAAVGDFRIRHRQSEDGRMQIRAGVHSGPVVAGVVGSKMPRYCLFGDTVNTASRMESTSMAMKIQISQSTHDLLRLVGGFSVEPRGETEIKVGFL